MPAGRTFLPMLPRLGPQGEGCVLRLERRMEGERIFQPSEHMEKVGRAVKT